LFNDKKESIHAVVGVWNQKTHDYVGSVAVDFDLTTLMRHLDDRKRSESTAFALIGDGLQVVAQSRPNMEDVGLHDGKVVERHLVDLIKKIGFTQDTNKAFTFLDMISGVNYYVQKIPDQPFVLLVNMDHDEIKKDIFSKVTIKFAETSFLAISFLVLIILIYRRETWLRSGAEAALEVANRATKAKSDFLAFTAHEIRSPLGFIMTGSEVMKQRLLGPVDIRYNEYLDGIHQNANMILEFITDILDEAHILEGNFKIVNTEVDIKSVINKAVTINAVNSKSRIKVKVEPPLPMLICDARRILQVLNNLISNALKYSKASTVVRVVARMEKDELYVEVIDQGSGMTEAEVDIALTQYGTLRKKNFDFIASYGLGLPIVKKLLKAHGAKLVIDSVVNVGTKISIIFPKEKLVWGAK
jgi:signal transduction histidine kinase